MSLVNAKEIIKKAFQNGYAVPHINTNNLEWTKVILLTAEEQKSPIIIGTSEGAVKYMGGFDTVVGMVKGMIKYFKISIPVVLHLDHGSYEGAKLALKAGYSSVMFDGSSLPFEENKIKTKEIIELAKECNASTEVEVGTLSGVEDGIEADGEVADPNEVAIMASLGPDMIAAGINNIHGPYPQDWKGLNFDVLSQLKAKAQRCLVLHGGSGIPDDQIKKSISMGVAKINVNTELQIANAKAIRNFVKSGESEKGKNYDPRKFLAPGVNAMRETIISKMKLFNSIDKA